MPDLAVSRRALLGGAAAAGFGLAYAGSLEAFARPEPRHPGGEAGYGPLVPDPNPGGWLSLPAGFTYVVVAWLTCEETERRKDTVIGGRTLQKDHGYVFEVDPASQAANVDKSPVPAPVPRSLLP